MKLKNMIIQWKAFGGLNTNLKDWRVLCFALLAFIAGIANTIQMFILKYYHQLYIPILWFILGALILVVGHKLFTVIFFIIATTIIMTDGNYGYRSLAIFILMILVTTRTIKVKSIVCSLLILLAIIASTLRQNNVMDIFAIIIQVGFAFFCYYGFIYTSSKAFGCKSKMQYNDKEYRVMYALATQDKTQKEICYELGISGADLARTLASAREKNGYTTNDMLLRQFAIELYKSNL